MLTREAFIARILEGRSPSTPATTHVATRDDALAGFDGFDTEPGPTELEDVRYAQLLLEESGFGRGETLPRTEVVLGSQATSRFLPRRATYWSKAADRPFHVLSVELESTASALLGDPFFRSTDQLEDALHRIVQDVLEGFERGGAGATADVRRGLQHETLAVVSIRDDRGDEEPRQVVCFATKSVATGALEAFVLREEARDWAARGDLALAREHLGQLYARHFRPLASGAAWQDAFVTGPEFQKAEALLAAARTMDSNATSSTALAERARDLLDEIAWSFGIPRRQDGSERCLDMVELPTDHGIGVASDASLRPGHKNPLRGVRIYDGAERLLGFLVYFPRSGADLERLREGLRAHNHFHNVLVVHPDPDSPHVELWQGSEPLRGRLVKGTRRSRFDGPGGVVQLLSRFFVVSRSAISKPADLATELAWRARHLKSLARTELERERTKGRGALADLHEALDAALAPMTAEEFADAYAQTITYGMLAARWLSADRGDVLFARKNVAELLPSTSPFLHELFRKLLASEFDKNLTWLLDDVASLLARTSVTQVFEGERDPSIHFYQDFLDAYDPEIRRAMGVYYTPDELVRYMVRSLDQAVRERWGLPLGLADASTWRQWSDATGQDVPKETDPDTFVVQILDPAVGTGTFLVHLLEVVFETMLADARANGVPEEEAAAAWKRYVHAQLLPRLNAFELMMAPYIVAHLRVGLALERGLAEAHGLDPDRWGYEFEEGDRVRIFLTNTLELNSAEQVPLLGDAVATEARDADAVKRETAISVILGNPPYGRVARETDGQRVPWVVSGTVPGRTNGKSLFDDVLDVARAHTIFSHQASLYNLYVYFWRWAFWKAFERDKAAPAAICFVTASSWLTGPGFVGLRKLLRDHSSASWTTGLGGNNRSAVTDENVFAIETPVAVTLAIREAGFELDATGGASYQLVEGATRTEKLAALKRASTLMSCFDSRAWLPVPSGAMEPLTPSIERSAWTDFPKLDDMFPWQQPGCKFNRLWPVAPTSETLYQRWSRFVASKPADRPALFQTAATGRNIHTQVGDLSRLVDEPPGTPPKPVVRYGYRSFDRQWTFADPRVAALDRPSLWASLSDRQIFLVARMTHLVGPGPLAVATPFVPDLDSFRGAEGGKDVIPLYRDAEAAEPNLAPGLLAKLEQKLGVEGITPEDVAAYVYALLGSHAYQRTFAEALATPGPRIALTKSTELWTEAVREGRRLLWLHTYAERFRDEADGRGERVPEVPGLEWIAPVDAMPERPADLRYDVDRCVLHVGSGRIAGVRSDVWGFEVSGMPVVKKWLGYRTVRGAGRAASSKNPLDRIRPTTWPDAWSEELLDLLRVLTLTLDAEPRLAELLEGICAGPTFTADELPVPPPESRQPPAVASPRPGTLFG